MDHLAGDGSAAPPTNIYEWDLVTYQPPEECDRGLQVAVVSGDISGPAVTVLKLLCVDWSLVNVKAGDVTVVDRSYLRPCMSVASATSTSDHLAGGQIGVVTGAYTLLDLVRLDDDHKYVPTAPVIRGVPASTPGLRRVRRLNLGDFVVSGPWLGRVLELSVDVDVLLADGTVRRFADAESKQQILPEHKNTWRYYKETGLYYPGQHVYSKPSAVHRPFRNGVIVKVEVSGVLVHWVASPHCGTDKDLVMASAPPAYQRPRDLTYFCSSNTQYHPWAVADRCFLDGAAAATATGIDDDDHSAPAASANNRHRRRRRKNNNNKKKRLDQLEVPWSIFNTHTTVDVLWQDGTRQCGVPSTSLVPFVITVPNEFFPGQYVIDNAPLPTTTTTAAPEVAGDHGDDDDGLTTRGRVGMVRSLNFKDQTVRVSWLKAPGSRPHWLKCHDTVSVYDLQRHPRSSLHPFYGNIVVRRCWPPSLVPNDGGAESTAPLAAQRPADLSWVGRVINIPDGKVLVRWGDGSTSMVLHHEVCVVVDDRYTDLLKEYDTGEGEWVEDDDDDSDDDDAPPQETAGAADHRHANADVGAAVVLAGGWLSGAVRSVISLAGQVLAGGSRYLATWLPSSASSSSPTSESPAAMETVELQAPAVPAAGSDHQDEIISNNGGSAPGTEKAAAADSAANFPRFDVVAHTPPDHHYLDSVDQSGNGGAKKWVKAVQKEWKILEDSLPETIYVRAFEDRMDLLRAVMVGASGTPYHDGLFFFDMQLPATYPAAPPQVYYHSYGLHINPNLYPSGTVCLSLINTFGGEGTEVWSPAASTLLQVLVSIQGLVLNDDPYYNEPANEALAAMPEGRRSALPYGENVYLLSLRTALHVLRRPPLGFEEFVKDHFRRRGRFMIRACEACVQEGCAVGTLTDDDADTAAEEEMSMERRQYCSTGLKLALTNMLPSLVAAFAGVEGNE